MQICRSVQLDPKNQGRVDKSEPKLVLILEFALGNSIPQ
jgi:hypothetical protein